MDFQYKYAAREEVARYFPSEKEEKEGQREEGKEEEQIHNGFFQAFARLAGPAVHDEMGELVSKRKMKAGGREGGKEGLSRVLITGHSLGGAVAALLALYAAETYPDLRVDVVTFGAPNVGNAAFGRRFNSAVNNRHVRKWERREGDEDGLKWASGRRNMNTDAAQLFASLYRSRSLAAGRRARLTMLEIGSAR